MKKIIIFFVLNFLLTGKIQSQNSEVFLTDFTKEFIDLFISSNGYEKNRYITLWVNSDSLFYYLTIESNEPNDKKLVRSLICDYCNDSIFGVKYLGYEKYNKRKVYAFNYYGDINSIFVIPQEEIKRKKCKGTKETDFILYDPYVWTFCVTKKDLAFDISETNERNNITPIIFDKLKNLGEKYFKTINSIDENIDYNQTKLIDDVYFYYRNPRNYKKIKRNHYFYKETNEIILEDQNIKDTISIFSQITLQYDTTCHKMHKGNDLMEINYEIVNIVIDSLQSYEIKNISSDYLIPKIKSELRKWELNIGFNVKNPIYKENRKTFELKFVFVPSTSKID